MQVASPMQDAEGVKWQDSYRTPLKVALEKNSMVS